MIAVIGSGSWGTALVKILLEEPSRHVIWWVRDAALASTIACTGRNPRHLSSTPLDSARLQVSSHLASVVESASTLFIAVPSIYVHSTFAHLPQSTLQGKTIISTVKGFVPEVNGSVTQFFHHQFGVPNEQLCVVSGPSHAEEVAEGRHTFLAAASTCSTLAESTAQLLQCSYIHAVPSAHIKGIEICGMAKNIYAIAAGMLSARDGGDNLTAALAAATAREMHALTGLIEPAFASLGDLMVTCFSRHSRNRALGQALMRGVSPTEHFAQTGMVAEGYYSARTMHLLEKSTPTPIAEAVYRALYTHSSPHDEALEIIHQLGL